MHAYWLVETEKREHAFISFNVFKAFETYSESN